jgi:Flp pilus assembly pilin Flp
LRGPGRVTTPAPGHVLASVFYERLLSFWTDEKGQDIAEYALMLAMILVFVVGTIRLVGANANHAFSSAASSIQ